MKTLLMILATSVGFGSFARAGDYCSNEAKNAYVVRTNSQSDLNKDSVTRAEIITTTNDKVVLVPCFRNRALSQDYWQVNSFITKNDHVFMPIQSRAVGKFQAIAFNPWTNQFLVLQDNTLLPDQYFLVNQNTGKKHE